MAERNRPSRQRRARQPLRELDPEEVNLLYVAVTRAIRAVQLPPSLVAWLRDAEGAVDQPVALPATKNDTGRLFFNDALHENWLRENLERFGDAADEMRFLLQQLDAARAACS